MQSQHNSDNSYMWSPASNMTATGSHEDDLELLTHLSNIATSSSTGVAVTDPSFYTGPTYNHHAATTNENQEFGNSLNLFYQSHQHQQDIFPMVAPLASPPATELTDAVSRMNMEDQQAYEDQYRQQRMSFSSSLSLDIQPFISITEPTPVRHTMPTLGNVDQFIVQHSEELSQQNQFQQQYGQQQDNLAQLMDPTSFLLDDLLIAQSGTPDWLSWTPARGSSPAASIKSNSFDDQNSLYSTSPEPNALFYNMMMASEEALLGSSSSAAFGSSYPSQQSFMEPTTTSNNTLTVKKSNRSRRVSEPPKPSSSIIQEQPSLNTTTTDRPIRRSNSDHRRSRSHSNSSTMMTAAPSLTPGNHLCPHPGCGKSFARLYNLNSHQKIHSNDRPFACSQCGRKFARQHDRNRHEKLHWGIKPFACSHCKKPFARMDALNRHLRVENGCSTHIINNNNHFVQ